MLTSKIVHFHRFEYASFDLKSSGFYTLLLCFLIPNVFFPTVHKLLKYLVFNLDNCKGIHYIASLSLSIEVSPKFEHLGL
jgi:hypothetical protein